MSVEQTGRAAMEARFAGMIRRGMVVRDRDGRKVGTVAAAYAPTVPEVLVGGEGAVSGHEPLVEVTTGLLGLGRRLYLRPSAPASPLAAGSLPLIREITHDSVVLTRSRGELATLGWHRPPPWLAELRRRDEARHRP